MTYGAYFMVDAVCDECHTDMFKDENERISFANNIHQVEYCLVNDIDSVLLTEIEKLGWWSEGGDIMCPPCAKKAGF